MSEINEWKKGGPPAHDIGDRVKITSGSHAGKVGVVVKRIRNGANYKVRVGKDSAPSLHHHDHLKLVAKLAEERISFKDFIKDE